MPPGARLVEETKLLRDTSSLSASWEYETEWDWQKYSVWVSGRLPAAYGTKIGGTTKLHFRRLLHGDVFTVEIEKGTSNSPHRVPVYFHAIPN
jgi:hypothetical protein